ncbi:Cytochrome C oxidase, cbb3-type, subunit III [Modicisalibacter ilicicola DSM 19980]|uniref:Cytochrome C oxidase, cbb3-type, subunit III n=1 Tax=Modicisalibacter ilicicola DSM 19980 TaxID=1121942 RepID=A0A1M5AWS6_9GAMM|nr:cytochrome c [Halomonas ilicicola]SHF34660.1 Cytochrome C oxidase, cbb3-type, subunit III [Halomonas ilicicola DSM 19980]
MTQKRKAERRIKSVAGTSNKNFDPHESYNPIPWQVIAIALALAAWGIITLATTREMAESEPEVTQGTGADERLSKAVDAEMSDGRQLFVTNCSTCHQNNGSGIEAAVPPLAGSRYVLAEPEVPASIVLFGIQGEIEVAGDTYRGRMPTFGNELNDEQIASILSYVRNSWGNQASAIEAGLVAEQRRRFAERTTPWAGGAALAETFGIPATSRPTASVATSEESH